MFIYNTTRLKENVNKLFSVSSQTQTQSASFLGGIIFNSVVEAGGTRSQDDNSTLILGSLSSSYQESAMGTDGQGYILTRGDTVSNSQFLGPEGTIAMNGETLNFGFTSTFVTTDSDGTILSTSTNDTTSIIDNSESHVGSGNTITFNSNGISTINNDVIDTILTNATISVYTISGKNTYYSSGNSTYSTKINILTTNNYTSLNLQLTTGTTQQQTVNFAESVETIIFGQYDIGTIVSADKTDWLWSYDITDTKPADPDFLTNFGNSFESQIFWPTTTFSDIFFATEGVTDPFLIPGNSFTTVIESLTTSTTIELTNFSGSNFPRNSYTITGTSYTTTGEMQTVGNDSQQEFGASINVSTTTNIFLPITIYTYYPDRNNGNTTTSLNSVTSYLTTTEIPTRNSFGYIPKTQTSFFSAGSSFASAGGLEGGTTIQSTSIISLQPTFYQLPGNFTALRPVYPFGVLDPQNLHTNTEYNIGKNLSFRGGETIFYPFNFNNIVDNLSSPVVSSIFGTGKFSTTGAAGETWKYSLLNDTNNVTLKWSKISTSTNVSSSKTITFYDRTISSGVFVTVSEVNGDYVTDGGTIFGGFQPITDGSETVYFGPRAVLGTSIDSKGKTNSYTLINSSLSSSDIKGNTMFVEKSAQVYAIFLEVQNTLIPPLPFFAFTKNPTQ